MQIHELPQLTRTPVDSDVIAIDSGQSTYSLSLTDTVYDAIDGSVPAMIEETKLLVVEVNSFNVLPQTISNDAITADMVVVNSVLGTPSAQTSDWTVTTSAGSLDISGSISGSTTLTLYLATSR